MGIVPHSCPSSGILEYYFSIPYLVLKCCFSILYFDLYIQFT